MVGAEWYATRFQSAIAHIRKLRFANDEMTQQQLAEIVGVTRQTIVAALGESFDSIFSFDANAK